MKKQKNNKIVLIIILFLLSSCESNVFRIDKKGCIISRDKVIKYLEIKSENEEIGYILEKKKNIVSSTTYFCIDDIPEEYSIEKYEEIKGFINYKKVNNISLKRDKLYKFKVSGGDSGAFHLRVYIDSQGNYQVIE